MARLRPRDIRGIAFCAVIIPAVYITAAMTLHNQLYAFALTVLASVWLLSRPRMLRMYRRLRGESASGWGNYYQD